MTKQKESNKGKKKASLRFILINLAAMAAVMVAAVLITFRWIDSYTEHGVAIMVPDITGMQEEEAVQIFPSAFFLPVIHSWKPWGLRCNANCPVMKT